MQPSTFVNRFYDHRQSICCTISAVGWHLCIEYVIVSRRNVWNTKSFTEYSIGERYPWNWSTGKRSKFSLQTFDGRLSSNVNFYYQRGPNKVPLYSMAVVATVTITFIIVGDINTLAPIVTMPFLLTYACIDYSYFALAQTFDIQNKREERFRIQAQSPSYESRRYGSTSDHDNDLDHLFPDRTRHKSLSVWTFKVTE